MPTENLSFRVQYTGDEANELFFEPIFRDPSLLENFKVMTNVVSKKKMQFARKLEKIVRKYTGCGFTPIGKTTVYERCVEVEKMKVNIKQCIDEFTDTALEELLNRGQRINDLNDTLIEEIIVQLVIEGIRLDIQRIFWFSNTANPDPNYNQLDGLWTVHLPQLVTDNLVPYYNTGSGAPLVAGEGVEILRTVYDNSSNELKGLPASMRKLYVTGSIYDQYREDIENGGGGDYGLLQMINGAPVMTFRQVEIKANRRWDDVMSNDLGAPNSHLCLHTTPMNLVVATDIVNTAENLLVWFDELTEELYIKSKWKLGANYVHNSLMSVGF